MSVADAAGVPTVAWGTFVTTDWRKRLTAKRVRPSRISQRGSRQITLRVGAAECEREAPGVPWLPAGIVRFPLLQPHMDWSPPNARHHRLSASGQHPLGSSDIRSQPDSWLPVGVASVELRLG